MDSTTREAALQRRRERDRQRRAHESAEERPDLRYSRLNMDNVHGKVQKKERPDLRYGGLNTDNVRGNF